jgi:glycerol kinase
VRRNAVADTTALGAAYLAGLAEGVWGSLHDIAALWRASVTAGPADDRAAVQSAYTGWARAVERARNWA